MRISDWSSDVCSSDLLPRPGPWMATFRKWMAVPMGLTAAALAWLLWRQAGGGAALIYPAIAVAMIVILLWNMGSVQHGDGRRWPLAAPGLLLLGSVAGAAAALTRWEERRVGEGVVGTCKHR